MGHARTWVTLCGAWRVMNESIHAAEWKGASSRPSAMSHATWVRSRSMSTTRRLPPTSTRGTWHGALIWR